MSQRKTQCFNKIYALRGGQVETGCLNLAQHDAVKPARVPFLENNKIKQVAHQCNSLYVLVPVNGNARRDVDEVNESLSPVPSRL
ncbi:MAG: hypothetical protein E5W38_02005 [Mesorhizobium sp.]|nr:MAG: hypothetical protein E5W38_02005 [Mesorhizobium sp.]